MHNKETVSTRTIARRCPLLGWKEGLSLTELAMRCVAEYSDSAFRNKGGRWWSVEHALPHILIIERSYYCLTHRRMKPMKKSTERTAQPAATGAAGTADTGGSTPAAVEAGQGGGTNDATDKLISGPFMHVFGLKRPLTNCKAVLDSFGTAGIDLSENEIVHW